MDSKMLRVACLLPYVMFIVCKEQCEQVKFYHHSKFDDRKVNSVLFGSAVSADVVSDCARHCIEEESCVSFQFSLTEALCRSFSVGVGILDMLDKSLSTGYRTYVTGDRGQHYTPCQSSSDCIRNAECINQMCRCEIGYHYHPNKTCVTGCHTYGDDYTFYDNMNVEETNHLILPDQTFEQCMAVCNGDGACKAIEWFPGLQTCNILHLSWFDSGVALRRTLTDPVTTFGQRHCSLT